MPKNKKYFGIFTRNGGAKRYANSKYVKALNKNQKTKGDVNNAKTIKKSKTRVGFFHKSQNQTAYI